MTASRGPSPFVSIVWPSSHLPGGHLFRFAARGPADHLLPGAMSVRFVARRLSDHLHGPISIRFVFRGPQTTGPEASENNQKLCKCQSFGQGLREGCFLTPPSSPRLPGVVPEKREHTQTHAFTGPKVMHVPVYWLGLRRRRFLTSPSPPS